MRSNKTAYGEQEKKERGWILFHKRKAVLEHRKMWKWIAHAIAVDKDDMSSDVWDYKQKYLTTIIDLNISFKCSCKTKEERKRYDEVITYYRKAMVNADCFCCLFYLEYSRQSANFQILKDKSYESCKSCCPIVWERTTLIGTKTNDADCSESYCGTLSDKAFHRDWKKCCKLAYKIAMLPERSIEAYV